MVGTILLCIPLAMRFFQVFFILIALGFSGILFSFFASTTFEGGQFKTIWIAGIPLFLIFQSFLRKQWSFKLLVENLGVLETAWCLILFSFPLVFAIGTNNNYWEIGSWVSMFSLLAGSKVFSFGQLSIFNQNEFLFSVSACTLLIAFALLTSVSTPYRQDMSLRSMDTSLQETHGISVPSISSETSRTISSLKSIVLGVRPEFRTPLAILDLTGQSPGLIFAADGRTVGQPWLAGGYPGSESAMKWVLKGLTPCERASFLVLVEQHGSRSLSTELLSEGDWDFNENYDSLGGFEISAGTGFVGKSRWVELFQPNESLFIKYSYCY
jgi:hypothetical protein